MKVALVTDLHFGVRNDSMIFVEFFEQFYSNQFFPYIESNNINTVIILGDSFDRRKYTNHKIIKAARDILFDQLESKGIKTYILVGNHDSCFKNSITLNTLDLLLSHYNHITIIDRPQTIELGNCDVCMIPWICQDNYEESLQEIKDTCAEILMGHLELAGFEFHRGEVAKEGMSIDLFKKFDHVFSGHYHHRSTRGNITYLGTPYEMTWHDYNDPKGFHVFDTETRNLEFIENQNKMFIRLEYNDKNVEDKQSYIKSILEQYELKNKVVKLIVLNKNDYYMFDSLIQELHQVGCFDLKIIESISDIVGNSPEGIDLDGEVSLEDTQSILMNYIDNIGLSDCIDKEELKTFMKTLYLEALSEGDF